MSIIAKLETGLTPNWLREQLEQNGPWYNKTNERDKVNCLLRFHLSTANTPNKDVRGYLTDVDEEDVWLEAVTQKVIPVVAQHCC